MRSQGYVGVDIRMYVPPVRTFHTYVCGIVNSMNSQHTYMCMYMHTYIHVTCVLHVCMYCRNAWFAVDVGLWIYPTSYTLRHSRGYGRSALRNWMFQVSKDGKEWITIRTHEGDTALTAPG